MGVAVISEAKNTEINANQTSLNNGGSSKKWGKKPKKNWRKLNQSINGCSSQKWGKNQKLNQSINGGSHNFQIWKKIPLRSIV